MIEPILRRKLKAAGLKNFRKAAKEMANQYLETRELSASFDDPSFEGELTLEFDDSDLAELNRSIEELKARLPEIMQKLVDDATARMVRGYHQDWSSYRRYEEKELSDFRFNIQSRWGEALDALRMLIGISRQVGGEHYDRVRRSRAKTGQSLNAAMARLHSRSCQVASEIVVLLENGFADGAMARWRTLHEIGTVVLLISDVGDDLAQRYLDHELVESKRALDMYLTNAPALGYEVPSKTEIDAVNRDFAAVVKKYGAPFASPFGWAAAHLKNKSPRFSDIERKAGKAAMRSHYKMASYNVHATPKGLSFRLGLFGVTDMPIAGASNVGLEEPGQNTAITLTLITSLLVLKRPKKVDDLAIGQALVELRDEAVAGFVSAGEQLKREEAEIQRKRSARQQKTKSRRML